MSENLLNLLVVSGDLNQEFDLVCVIREPEPDDLEELNELGKLSWLEGFADVLTEDDLDLARQKQDFVREESLRESLDSEGVLALVYEKDDRVVGKAKLAYSEGGTHEVADVKENEVQLRSFYVHPDYWRQGIGSELLNAIVDRVPDWAEIDVDIVENDYPTVIMEKELE